MLLAQHETDSNIQLNFGVKFHPTSIFFKTMPQSIKVTTLVLIKASLELTLGSYKIEDHSPCIIATFYHT